MPLSVLFLSGGVQSSVRAGETAKREKFAHPRAEAFISRGLISIQGSPNSSRSLSSPTPDWQGRVQ